MACVHVRVLMAPPMNVRHVGMKATRTLRQVPSLIPSCPPWRLRLCSRVTHRFSQELDMHGYSLFAPRDLGSNFVEMTQGGYFCMYEIWSRCSQPQKWIKCLGMMSETQMLRREYVPSRVPEERGRILHYARPGKPIVLCQILRSHHGSKHRPQHLTQ